MPKVGCMVRNMPYGAKNDPALEHFQKALKLNPDSAIARIEHANVLILLFGNERLADATKLYEQAQVIFKQQEPWFTIAHAVQLKPVRKEVIDFKLSPFGRHNFYGVDIRG